MRALVPALALGFVLSTGCRQQIVVYECPDGGDHLDAATTVDAGDDAVDAGFALDAGDPVDAGTPDSGETPDAGGCDPFCLTGVDVSADTIDVREIVTLTPQVDAAPGVQWTVQVEAGDVVPERAEGRPAVVPQEVPTDLSPMGGAALGFRVTDVPPWFLETTYAITVRVQEVGTAFSATEVVRVTVRGNVVFSAPADGYVYAVASDGLPATGGGLYADGILLDMLVDEPRQLRLLSDGSLLVYDNGVSPKRVLRFSMDGPDVLQGELQFTDGANGGILRPSANVSYGLVEMSDGRIVLPEYQFSGTSGAPKSRLVVWGADGRFEREVWAPSAEENWRGVTQGPDGTLLVTETEFDVVDRVNPQLWQYDGRLIDQLPGSPFALEATTDALYIGGFGYVLQAPWSGGRAAVSGLDGNSTTAYRSFAEYTDGMVLVSNDRSSRTRNIAVIDGRAFVRWLRTSDSGPVATVGGIAYLR